TAGAVRVDLARAPLPALVEEEIDAHHRRHVVARARRGREARDVRMKVVDCTLFRVLVREAGDAADRAHDAFRGGARRFMELVREDERMHVHAPLSAYERIPDEVLLREL